MSQSASYVDLRAAAGPARGDSTRDFRAGEDKPRYSATSINHGDGAHWVGFKRDKKTWSRLVSKIDAVVRKMPLWKLQTVGLSQLEFLYEGRGHGSEIELKPGAAFCLRQFHGHLNE